MSCKQDQVNYIVTMHEYTYLQSGTSEAKDSVSKSVHWNKPSTHIVTDAFFRKSLTSLGVFGVQHEVKQIFLIDRILLAVRND